MRLGKGGLQQQQAFGRILQVDAAAVVCFYDHLVVGSTVVAEEGEFETVLAHG